MQESHQTNSILKDYKKDNTKELPPFVIDEKKVTEKQDKLIQLLDKAKELEEQGKYIQALQLYKEYQGEVSLYLSIERAREIMEANNKNFIGLEEINETFAVEFNETQIPEIPFTEEELIRAEELGQMLVLEIDKLPDGTPLTMKEINERLKERFKKEEKGKILNNENGWYANEPFFKEETVPEICWILKSKEVIPDSTNKNYLEQTQTIAKYIKEQVFTDQELPAEFDEAIQEFDEYYITNFAGKSKEEMQQILSDEWEKYAKELSKLKINQRYRETPVSAMQTTKILFDNSDYERLKSTYTWTSNISSSDELVFFGRADSAGVDVNDWFPADAFDGVGVVFSRSH